MRFVQRDSRALKQKYGHLASANYWEQWPPWYDRDTDLSCESVPPQSPQPQHDGSENTIDGEDLRAIGLYFKMGDSIDLKQVECIIPLEGTGVVKRSAEFDTQDLDPKRIKATESSIMEEHRHQDTVPSQCVVI